MGKTSLSFHMQLLLGKEQRQALLSTIGNTPARFNFQGWGQGIKNFAQIHHDWLPRNKWSNDSEVACSVGIYIQWPVYLATGSGHCWNIEVSRSSYTCWVWFHQFPSSYLSTLLPCLWVLHHPSPRMKAENSGQLQMPQAALSNKMCKG